MKNNSNKGFSSNKRFTICWNDVLCLYNVLSNIYLYNLFTVVVKNYQRKRRYKIPCIFYIYALFPYFHATLTKIFFWS